MDTAVESLPPEAKANLLPSAIAAHLSRRNVVPVSAALLVLVGIGDFFTGVDIAFTLLYVLPIALATWLRGRSFGYGLALSAAASGIVTAMESPGHHLAPIAVVWNQAGALGVFLGFVWLLDKLRAFVDDEQRKRGLAVSQLRHAERLNVIGTLAAGVAHELGTPLNVITGNAELLGSGHTTPEKVLRSSQAIIGQAKRMTDIISNLLEFGRRGGTSREPTDLRELIAKASALMAPIATRSQCTIVCTADAEGPQAKVLVNPGEIEQVIANLILNAVQAMPSGGRVRVKCELEPTPVGRRDAKQFVCLVVEDEGSGIRPADMPRIFDPFFTTKGVGKGTGLGLSVTYGIVEDHKGTIHVKSEVGHGTRFVVRLPTT